MSLQVVVRDETMKRKSLAAVDEIPSDTLAAVWLLHKQYYNESNLSTQVPLVLAHQLYSIIDDRTVVDRELDEARLKGQIRLLKLTTSNSSVIVFEKDYKECLMNSAEGLAGEKERKPLITLMTAKTFHDRILSTTRDVSISRSAVIEKIQADANGKNCLVSKMSSLTSAQANAFSKSFSALDF